MSGIRINDSILKNACFAQSNFSNSHLQQLNLLNISFVKADFTCARLAMIKLDEDSTFGNANFKNAFLNAITLTDKVLGDGIEINEISYFGLIRKALARRNYKDKRNHTEFLFVDTQNLLSYDLIGLKKYAEWYMTVSKKISSSEKKWNKKFSIMSQIIISKFWSSYSVFGVITLLTILFLSFCFSLISYNFNIIKDLKPIDFFDSIYFVVVTFTTLGYGDITPINWVGQLFVIITSLTGYLFLGIFIYLLSKKIDSN